MKITIMATALFLTAVSANGQTPKPQPALKETLGWIQDSLKSYGDVEKETAEGTEIHAFRLADFSGCRVHFVYTEAVAGNEMLHLEYSFDLSVIDPILSGFSNLGTSRPGLFIAVTRDYLEKIALNNALYESTAGFTAEFYSPYGDDFAKAFVHAVKMCGDKPPFFTDSDEQDSDKHTSHPTGGVAAQSAPPRKGIPAIAKAANGSIVSIVMSDKDGKPIAQGSGFFVSKDGLIVTNYHVIAEGSSAVGKLPDGAFFVVDGVLASDKHRDVALIKAHGENFKTLTLGNSDRLQVGEEVVAIGNPLSLESTVSNGIVSGIRTVEEEGGKFLQVTTPISHGSSGGPLFNMAGEVVGITTLSLKGGENLNFAIPINDVKRFLLNQSARLQSFPNEVEPKQTSKETPKEAHDTDNQKQATFSEQKSCLEQAEKMFNDSPFSRHGSGSNKYVSHFDVASNLCYVEVTSFSMKGNGDFEWHVLIYDAFANSLYGEFMSSAESDKLKVLLCGIRPRGQPEITCRSDVEFYDLVRNHFGIVQH